MGLGVVHWILGCSRPQEAVGTVIALQLQGWGDVGGLSGEEQDATTKLARLPPHGMVIPTAPQPQYNRAPMCRGCAGGPWSALSRRRAHGRASCPGRPPRARLRGHAPWVRAVRAAENAPSSAHAQAFGLRRLSASPCLACDGSPGPPTALLWVRYPTCGCPVPEAGRGWVTPGQHKGLCCRASSLVKCGIRALGTTGTQRSGCTSLHGAVGSPSCSRGQGEPPTVCCSVLGV